MLGKDRNDEQWNLSECFKFTLRSLTRLGTHMPMDTDRKRALSVTIMIAGSLLYWIWEADLTNFLVSPSKDFPFHSMKEFYTKTDKKVRLLEI